MALSDIRIPSWKPIKSRIFSHYKLYILVFLEVRVLMLEMIFSGTECHHIGHKDKDATQHFSKITVCFFN